MEESVSAKGLSALTLAWYGDSVWELMVRSYVLRRPQRKPDQLNKAASELSSARAQSALVQALLPKLTEEETAVFRRGRNAKNATMARHATANEYRRATGLEALWGHLYLQKEEERLRELFDFCTDTWEKEHEI